MICLNANKNNPPKPFTRRILLAAALSLPLLLASCAGEPPFTVTPSDAIEANKIINLLNQYGIKADQSITTKDSIVTIQVTISGSEEQKQAAIQILNDYHLPRKGTVVPEADGALPPSGFKEKLIKKQMAARQIEDLVMPFRGVVDVKALVDIPDTMVKALEPTGPSVSVHVTSIEDPPLVTPEQVKALLSTSLNGLKQENITVAITPNKPKIPLPQPGTQIAGTKWPSRKVIGIGTGLLLVVGAIAGVWFLRKRRQDDWEEEPEDEEETAEETGETGPPKQLSTS